MKIDAYDIYSVQGVSKELGEQQPYAPSSRRRDICSQREFFDSQSVRVVMVKSFVAKPIACFVK
jgi:hypothetical protein